MGLGTLLRCWLTGLRWLVLSGLCLLAAGVVAQEQREIAEVRLGHRVVAEFRAEMLGIGPEERARRAEEDLARALAAAGGHRISRRAIPQGQVILVDGVFCFVLLEGDVAPGAGSIEDAAERSVRAIERALAESAESSDRTAQVRAALYLVGASLVLAALLWGLARARRGAARWLARLAHDKAEKLRLGGEALLQRERVLAGVRRLVASLHVLLVLLLLYEWLSLVLEIFPATRPWGEGLNGFLYGVLKRIFGGILESIPNLVIAVCILLLAKLCVDLLAAFFDRVERGAVELPWLDEDTVRPTRRLISVAVWLFAFAMAYPYLPGAQTEAFRGLSVLVGLMISLGASSIVGQAASGLILMYTRMLRVGEYVRIGESEGTVLELGLFAIRIRTGLGEELSIPNSLVLGNVTRNCSRAVEGDGYVADTSVTIGYDTPWRQVHAMLIEAARRTPGVAAEPPPRVFQTALSDFYPQYRLVCRAIPRGPGPRAELLSALHANIQDVFNEYGVQIMSPHYIDDSATPKVVPPDRWRPAPVASESPNP